MSDESRERRYLRLVQEESEAFARAAKASEQAGPERRENLARDWFAASARLLKEYHRFQGGQGPGETSLPYPDNAIVRLANLAETLAAGRIPQPVRDITAAGGRPDRWPGERRAISVALQYIAHARSGAINDKRFIVTVCNAFSVDRTTVRDWQRRQGELTLDTEEIPADQFPDALSVAGARYHFNRTGEITEGVD